MSKTVFISYSHKQKEWVRYNLVPCLRAGGAEVRIDVEQMRAGENVTAQMDDEQDACDLSVLVLSQEYLESEYCQHEMRRAIACNKFVAVLRAECEFQDEVKKTLYVALRDDKDPDQWDLLMRACEADLGTDVPTWLKIRDEIVKSLKRNKSVCLETKGSVKWRELIRDIQGKYFLPNLHKIDLQNGATASRRGLVQEILRISVLEMEVPAEPEDLVTLKKIFAGRSDRTLLALSHFEMVTSRKTKAKYDVNLFAALKDLQESGKLSLLIQTKRPFSELLPQELKDSPLNLETQILIARN